MKPTKQAFNNRTIQHFTHQVYSNVLMPEQIMGDEIATNISSQDKTPGYTLKKDLKTYFVRTEDIPKLPFRVKDSFALVQGSKVFHVVTSYSSVKIEPNPDLTFRELVDGFCNFEHTIPNHFLLWKIITISAYLNRVNYRLATPPAFGKDSCLDSLHDLTTNCIRVDNATFAKLEYALKYPYIMCNEVAGLKPDEKEEFKSFGLSVGAFQNSYTKRSRGSKTGAREMYDISNLSLGFTYNNKATYVNVGGDGFDKKFPEQFLDRFLPLKMKGQLIVGQFAKEGEINFEEECKANLEFYKSVIRTLQHLKENVPKKKGYKTFMGGLRGGRHERSFSTICLYIQEYSEDEKEYEKLCKVLLRCYEAYLIEELEIDVKQEDLVVESEVIQ